MSVGCSTNDIGLELEMDSTSNVEEVKWSVSVDMLVVSVSPNGVSVEVP